MNRKIILIKKNEVERKEQPPAINLSPDIILNKLYLTLPFEGDDSARKYIKKKISSYQMQDKKKEKLDISKFITYNELIEKMVASKMRCYYCRQKCYFSINT